MENKRTYTNKQLLAKVLDILYFLEDNRTDYKNKHISKAINELQKIKQKDKNFQD